MKRPIVALLTDYGLRDPYVAQLKGVILSYNREAILLDVTHEIQAFNELEAAFLLKIYVPHLPEGTIHLCVIDPGVGTERKGIIFQTKRGDIFIGPDTGFMYPAAESLGLISAYYIDESRLPPRVSETFHGRDVFAHVAGKIISGTPLNEVGLKTSDYKTMTLPSPVVREVEAEGVIMHVDRFGNLVTNIPAEIWRPKLGEELEISFREEKVRCNIL